MAAAAPRRQVRRQQSQEVWNSDLQGFFSCVRRGKVEEVKHYINKVGIDVNATDPWDNCPLYLASLCGHLHMVKYLLKAGARYDAQSIDGQRCFLSALTIDIRSTLQEYQSGSACHVSERPTESPGISNLTSFLQTMYERTPDYDVELIVADQRFLGHKCILCVRCSYFHRKLTAPDSLGLKTLELTDPVFTPESLRAMLQFLYTGSLDVPIEDVEETQQLAAFLGFTALANCIEAEMKQSKTVDEDHREAVLSVQDEMLTIDLQYGMRKLVMSAVPQLLHPLVGGSDQTTEGSKEDMASISTPIFPDICFCVGNQQFECHKMFFYGRSEYFRIMLIENQDNQPPAMEGYRPMVKLDDITEEDFVHVISYLYQDQCLLGVTDQQRLSEICERWTLPQLKLQLEIAGHGDVTIDNVMQIFPATRKENENLRKKCYQCMSENFMELSSKHEFHQFIKQQLITSGQQHQLEQDSIVSDLLYHMRNAAHTWHEKKYTNKKIKKLNYIVSNRLGYEANFELFDIPVAPPKPPQITVDTVMQVYQGAGDGDESLRKKCYQCMSENLMELSSKHEFHQFLKRELPAPGQQKQEVQDSIISNLLYHIRTPAHTWQEKKFANEKIKKLNYIVSNRLGYQANFTLFDIPDMPPGLVNNLQVNTYHKKSKKSSDSCAIS